MIRDLVDILDRSWRALSDERGLDFALNCFPFFEQLQRDARTNALLADLRREDRQSRQTLREREDAARTHLRAIVDTLAHEAPDSFESIPEDPDDYDASLDAVRQRLAPPQRDDDDEDWASGRESDDDDRLDQAFAIARTAAERGACNDLRNRITEAVRALEHARRVRRTAYRTSAASALARIERDLRDLHPPAVDPGTHAYLSRLARTRQRPLGQMHEALFGSGTHIDDEQDRAVEAQVQQMRSDVRRVYEEIRRRLGTERSLLAVFERYRQRCQWYEAERLQVIAEKGSGKPEDRLTETLAGYLFDHGLNPLTRPLAGQLQPDLLGTDTRFSFYVEAKQYKKAARAYLLDGIQQVWDMLDQLNGTGFDVTEAFYVIYRRSGPRYSFPPRLQYGERIVHVLVVDLAPSSERGSRAPQTYAIESTELVPRSVEDDPQGRSVTRTMGRRTKRS